MRTGNPVSRLSREQRTFSRFGCALRMTTIVPTMKEYSPATRLAATLATACWLRVSPTPRFFKYSRKTSRSIPIVSGWQESCHKDFSGLTPLICMLPLCGNVTNIHLRRRVRCKYKGLFRPLKPNLCYNVVFTSILVINFGVASFLSFFHKGRRGT